MDFEIIETALVTWLSTATGATAILYGQKGTQPPLPYATIRVTGPRTAANSSSISHPAVQTFDPSRVGEEIERRFHAQLELTVSVQAFTEPTAGGSSAKALLQLAKRSLALDATLQDLRAAGLALIEVGDTQDLTGLLDTGFQGRAVMDLRLLVADEVAERTGFIAEAAVTSSTT